jgi:hypothetical protein
MNRARPLRDGDAPGEPAAKSRSIVNWAASLLAAAAIVGIAIAGWPLLFPNKTRSPEDVAGAASQETTGDPQEKSAVPSAPRDAFLVAAERVVAKMKEEVAKNGAPPFAYFFDSAEVPRPYVLAVENVGVPRPEAMAASIGEILGALQRTFTRRYAGLLASRDLAASPLPVFVFGSRARYNGWRRDSGALYLRLRAASEDKESTLDPIEEIRAVAWREGARQIVRALAPNGSRADGWDPWMDFGFFEYVGCYSRLPEKGTSDGWAYFLGVPNPGLRSAIISHGLASREDESEPTSMEPSLREIVHTPYAKYWDALARATSRGADAASRKEGAEQIDAIRSISWGLCHFLQHAENAKYRPRFDEWLRAEVEGEGSPEFFKKIFGLDTEEKWDALELAFENYVAFPLRVDARKISIKDDKVLAKIRGDFDAACGK